MPYGVGVRVPLSARATVSDSRFFCVLVGSEVGYLSRDCSVESLFQMPDEAVRTYFSALEGVADAIYTTEQIPFTAFGVEVGLL